MLPKLGESPPTLQLLRSLNIKPKSMTVQVFANVDLNSEEWKNIRSKRSIGDSIASSLRHAMSLVAIMHEFNLPEADLIGDELLCHVYKQFVANDTLEKYVESFMPQGLCFYQAVIDDCSRVHMGFYQQS